MPPRGMKKTPPGPGSKRAARGCGPAAAAAANMLAQVPPESNVEADEEIEVKEKETEHQEKARTGEKLTQENGNVSVNKSEDAKEYIDEYEKDEQLDLDDNEPEYEPGEYGGEYDEKQMEQDPEELEGGEEEDPEEVDVGEEEDAVVEEEIGSIHEELEHEEDDERVHVEHAEMAYADEEERHQIVKERCKRKEFEVFVGGLDKDATDDDLRNVFSEVGELTEVRLMMNPQTKKNKGFAFLRFATVEQAKRACAELKNPVVHGKQCGVTPSQDSDTLFLGNICRTWTKEALKEKLKHYGVDSVEDLTLVEDCNSVGLNRGFAFLVFSSRSDAMDAFKRLQRRDVTFGVDRLAKVSFADSFIDPGDEIMAQVKTVFIDGLCASWDEDQVKELLKIYGGIERVELARNMPSAKRKDFGFVTFDTHGAAVTCAKSINNEELGEGDKKAKVRARLSRPLQRGKGKHVARGDFRPGIGMIRGSKGSWSRSVPHTVPVRGPRSIGLPRLPPVVDRGFRKPVGIRDKKPVMAVPSRARPVAPMPRSYDRWPPVPPYPKSGLKRDHGHREELHSRGRAVADYSSRVTSDRQPSYRDDYPHRTSGYPDVPRGGSSRSSGRRAYVDDGYIERHERSPPPSFQEGRWREDDSISGSKRPYAAVDDAPRYTDAGMRHSRAHLDYDVGGSAPHYGDPYSDRLGRSNLGYGGRRSSLASQDSHGMGYNEGFYGGSDVDRMYSSRYAADYVSRGGDVGGSSYSSLYPGSGLGGNSYMRGSGSGSYY